MLCHAKAVENLNSGPQFLWMEVTSAELGVLMGLF